jgi:quercetin dioxygenase-like cupin family protein
MQAASAGEPAIAPDLTIEKLLSAQLASVEGTEVVVSRVVMPQHTALPRHWHPGEEFAYVLDGSTILRRDGKPDMTVSKGELIRIPLKEVHSAVTTDQGATILVFRVHEQGRPERILVGDTAD